jgi:integrase/recombinase XerD
MRLADLDRQAASVVVRLKGARDEHRVPVGDDFWRRFSAYVREERGLGEPHAPAWVTLRGGRGRPLRYATFESSLRHIGRKVGANVNAHMFRHTLAQALVETSGLKVAQEVLGHRHLSSTADAYARVDFAAMVRALERAQGVLDATTVERKLDRQAGAALGECYVFPYDPETLAELDRIATGEGGPRRRARHSRSRSG